MTLTKALKNWAHQNLGVAADASDEAYRKAIHDAMDNGKLSAKKFAELSEDDEPDPRKELEDIVSKAVKAAMPQQAAGGAGQQTSVTDQQLDDFDKRMDAMIDKQVKSQMQNLKDKLGHTSDDANKAVAGSAGGGDPANKGAGNIRVKEAVETYTHNRSNVYYPPVTKRGQPNALAGHQIRIGDRCLESPSNRDKAICGAFLKWSLFQQTRDPFFTLTDHDKGLVEWALKNERFNGPVGCMGDPDKGLYHEGMQLNTKTEYALVNDVATGGAYAVPEIWDDAVVTNALLYGELFPHVKVSNLPKGSFVHGMKLATDPVINPTPGTGQGAIATYHYGYSGSSSDQEGGDGIGRGYTQDIHEGNMGTHMQVQQYGGTSSGVNFLQSMASVIDHYDVGIYPVVAALQIGLDWESDSPVAWGNTIIERISEKMQEWLDCEIAYGSGNNEPLGLYNCTGTTVTATNSGSTGPIVVADLEKLIFGLSKPMRKINSESCKFVMRDSQYRLCRSIPWLAGAAATAQARAMGMDIESYKLFEHDVKINELLPHGWMSFVNLSYYRMFRRLGMNIRQTTEGLNLAMQNSRLIIGRARWGGKLTYGSNSSGIGGAYSSYSMAKMTTAEWGDRAFGIGYPKTSYGPAVADGTTYYP